MDEAIDILIANVNRIKTAECRDDETVAFLETLAFKATLEIFMLHGKISQAEYGVMRDYLVDFSAKHLK